VKLVSELRELFFRVRRNLTAGRNGVYGLFNHRACKNIIARRGPARGNRHSHLLGWSEPLERGMDLLRQKPNRSHRRLLTAPQPPADRAYAQRRPAARPPLQTKA